MTESLEELKSEELTAEIKLDKPTENHQAIEAIEENGQASEIETKLQDENDIKPMGDPEQYIKHRLQNK